MKNQASSLARPLDPAAFEREVDGKPVRLFTLRNAAGMVACITNYGAKIEQILVPDRHGQFDDVVLGYDSLDGVMNGAFAVGAFVGRYAGRIENARFTLNGTEHRLSANNGPHCLHGGAKGSFCQVFEAVQSDASSVEMRHVFADGEEGFPGTLALRLTYRLGETNELHIDYEVLALDQPTVASFTTHAFFNLNGAASGSALNHEVMIAADQYFGMTPELIATGQLLPVERTPFDLRQPTLLSSRVRGLPTVSGPSALAAGWLDVSATLPDSSAAGLLDGYDDCFLVNQSGAGVETEAGRLALCARVRAPQSGRVMEVWSTEPALQFYSGLRPEQALPGPPGKGGRTYFQQMGLCFEPEGYPNAPNCPAFPSAVCEPGKKRSGRTIYRFGAEA
ncbi:MAG: galactose mutarotase [Pseudomonadota bacterium]|nr:galactose mutarotase [Pseudomonadota bacterium]